MIRSSRWVPVQVAVGLCLLVSFGTGFVAFRHAGRIGASDQRLVSIFAIFSGGAMLLALMLLVTGWLLSAGLASAQARATRPDTLAARPTPLPRQGRRRFGLARLGPVLLALVLVSFGVRWYRYVTTTEAPAADRLGSELNRRMPSPMRDWGCARLKARLETKGPPPPGCSRPDHPERWR